MQVNRIKPSTACEPCRKRRAKCDRRRPSCMQCLKTSRTCTGYREQLDLILRDESRKFGTNTGTGRTFSSPRTTPPPSTGRYIGPARHQHLTMARSAMTVPARSPQPAPAFRREDLAVNFFLFNFRGGMYLDYLPLLNEAPHSGQDSIFQASFEAVAMCYFARSRYKSSLWLEAMKKHSIALQKTTEALSTGQGAVQDAAIAAVMLLAFYTALSKDSTETSRVWTNHIQGAMTLISMRPLNTLQGNMFQSLLSHVIGCIHLDCLHRKVSLPPQLKSLYNLSVQARHPFQMKFWRLLQDLAELKRGENDGELSDIEVVEQARLLDQEAEIILDAIPAIHSSDDGSDFIRHPLHKHSDHRATQVTNTIRLLRLSLNEYLVVHGIRGLSLPSDRSVLDTLELQLAIERGRETLRRLTEDICNSVPMSLRVNDEHSQQDINPWICSLMWPIAVRAQSRLIPEALRTRLLLQLKTFAEMSDNTQISHLAMQAAQEQVVPVGYVKFRGWTAMADLLSIALLYLS